MTRPSNLDWEGRCAGWAPASIAFEEPRPVTLKNPWGIEVPFGSSDIKALLTYYNDSSSKAASPRTRSESYFLGDRCNIDLSENPARASEISCRDTNAGSFHVVLANLIGIAKKGFVIDQTHDAEVWNQPVHGYSTRVLSTREPSSRADLKAVSEIVVETTVVFTVEVQPNWSPLIGTRGHANAKKVYLSSLEIDATGAIVGGEWLSPDFQPSDATDRPDFMWRNAPYRFEGYYSKLQTLYRASIQ
jgi:hypothetical protein